jgi:uncharacterized protein (UPF0335 family)
VSNVIAREQLESIIERVERVQAEIDGLNSDKSEIFKEAKSNGFNTKVIKKILKIRAADPIEREEEDAILDLYLHALGMASDGLVRARVENIEENGSVRGSDAAAPPKGTSESLSLPAGGRKPEEAGSYSNSDGNNLPGGSAVSSAPTESASDEISASQYTPPAAFPCEPDGAQGKHASEPEGAKSDAASNGSLVEGRENGRLITGNSEEAVTLSAACVSSQEPADLPEGSEPSGLSSNLAAQTVPAVGESAEGVAPQPLAPSAEIPGDDEEVSNASPIAVGTRGTQKKLPVPPPRHVPRDLPSFLDRRKMNPPANVSTENLGANSQ